MTTLPCCRIRTAARMLPPGRNPHWRRYCGKPVGCVPWMMFGFRIAAKTQQAESPLYSRLWQRIKHLRQVVTRLGA
jgi:hypothetical protein